MVTSKKPLVISLLTVGLGVAWLLNTLGMIPGVNWIWTLALAVLGLLTLAAGPINRYSFVIGCFLVCASALSVLRQTGRLRTDIEVPILVILLGLLMLAAHLIRLPVPKWMSEAEEMERARK